MKGLFFTLVVVALQMPLYAQGTIQFSNLNSPSVNAPVFEFDGVTKLAGAQFMAELLAGNSANSLVSIATTGFLTGNGAGYFFGGSQAVPGVPGGVTAWVEVDMWNTASGNSFAQAQASGLPNSWAQSSIFTVVTGRGGVNPTPPAALTGLGNSPIYLNSVPEPSALALAGFGAAVVFLRRRLTIR